MELTRHFVATAYIVHDGATALHPHARLGLWLPPGGHLARDELPHEAARREVREETGLTVELLAEASDMGSATVRSLPEPDHLLLEDIDVHDGRVSHQHIDFVYFGRVDSRDLEPAPGEASAAEWEWFTAADLTSRVADLEPDVVEFGSAAIEAVDGTAQS